MRGRKRNLKFLKYDPKITKNAIYCQYNSLSMLFKAIFLCFLMKCYFKEIRRQREVKADCLVLSIEWVMTFWQHTNFELAPSSFFV